MATPKHRFSIVIEWENAKLSELDRAREMLLRLSQQIRELDPAHWHAPELVILYDRQAIDPALITNILNTTMGATPPLRALKLIPVTGKRYYELKNYGATQTEADILVFLDSDVIPEAGWLNTLLSAAEQPGVDLVCGNTYIDMHSIYTRAFALFWFFPLRASNENLVRTERFFANNVALKKQIFDTHPFPTSAKLRGQCADLARQLVKEGYGLYLHQGARVSHPPPNGLSHFIKRALCAGHDFSVIARESGTTPTFKSAVKRFLRQMKQAAARKRAHQADVEVGMIGGVVTMGIASAYFVFMLLGECITIVSPTLISRRFAV